MTDVRVGDKVEVVYRYEGIVDSVFDRLGRVAERVTNFTIKGEPFAKFSVEPDDRCSIVVLKKAPPKVGDIIGKADLPLLVRGSVVRVVSADKGATYVALDGRLRHLTGNNEGFPFKDFFEFAKFKVLVD